LAVEKKDRMSAKSMAPSAERKPPEIFYRGFGLIVGEGHRWIVKKAQRVLFALCKTQSEIVSGSARHMTAPFSASLFTDWVRGAWASWNASTSARTAS
jgi:hypothetical protein